jgi:hypothetical protein
MSKETEKQISAEEMERWDVVNKGTWVDDMMRRWNKLIYFYIFMSSFY